MLSEALLLPCLSILAISTSAFGYFHQRLLGLIGV
jgi:hypothetical protein